MSISSKRSWDASKFIATLNYFGEVPFLGSFRWLQRLMGQKTTYTGIDISVEKKVFVLSSNVKNTLSAEPERLSFDEIFQSQSWQNQLKHQMESRLSSPTHFVFHNSISDFPELTAELTSSSTIVITGNSTLSAVLDASRDSLGKGSADAEYRVFDFGKSSEIATAWGTLDDVVMGGVSQSRLLLDSQGQAIFSGNVSTENSGGFASVRTKNFEPPFNFSGWEGMRLSVKGDGQRYKFILRNSEGWDSPAYIYSFDTQPDVALSVDVPFAKMVPTFRAKSMPDALALDPSRIYSFQLMLSKFEYDRQLNPQFEPGPFSLAVSTIGVYRQRQDVLWIVVTDESVSEEAWKAKLAERNVNYRWLSVGSASSDSLTAAALAEQIADLAE